MNEYDIMCQVRESFSGLHMQMPADEVFARSRARRRRRRYAWTTVAAASVGAATALTLTLGGRGTGPAPLNGLPAPGGPAPTRVGTQPPPSPGSVRLAAFSVTKGPGDSTTLVLAKGTQGSLDPNALRQALAQHGIPALVTVGTFCRSALGAPAGLGQVVHPSSLDDGSAMVISGKAMPPGTKLSIGYFRGHVRMALIRDGAPLSCGSTFNQPAMRTTTPTGTSIRS